MNPGQIPNIANRHLKQLCEIDTEQVLEKENLQKFFRAYNFIKRICGKEIAILRTYMKKLIGNINKVNVLIIAMRKFTHASIRPRNHGTIYINADDQQSLDNFTESLMKSLSNPNTEPGKYDKIISKTDVDKINLDGKTFPVYSVLESLNTSDDTLHLMLTNYPDLVYIVIEYLETIIEMLTVLGGKKAAKITCRMSSGVKIQSAVKVQYLKF